MADHGAELTAYSAALAELAAAERTAARLKTPAALRAVVEAHKRAQRIFLTADADLPAPGRMGIGNRR